MENSDASPTPGETWLGDVAVVWGGSLIEMEAVRGLLPGFRKKEQINVIVS